MRLLSFAFLGLAASALGGCGVDPSSVTPASSARASSAPATATGVAQIAPTSVSKGEGERQGVGAPPPPPPGLPNASDASGDGHAEIGGVERRSGGKRMRGTVKAATASSASGRLSASDVESVVDANIDQLGACVGADGAVVTIRALVSPAGKVLEATSPKSSPDDPRVRDCVAQAFKHLEFPAASGGANAPLAFDLALESAS